MNMTTPHTRHIAFLLSFLWLSFAANTTSFAAIVLSENSRSHSGYVEYSHLGSTSSSYEVNVPNGTTAHVKIERTNYQGQNEDRSQNRFNIYKDNVLQNYSGTTYEATLTSNAKFSIGCKTEAYYHVEIVYSKQTGLPIGHKNVYWTAYYCRYYYTISVTYNPKNTSGGGGSGGGSSANPNFANIDFVSEGNVITSKQYRISYNYLYTTRAMFPEPQKDGCSFLGWRLSDTDEQVVVRSDKVAREDCAVHALWARDKNVAPVSGFSFGTDSKYGDKTLWTRQSDGSYRSRGSSHVNNNESTWMTAVVNVPSGGRYLSFEYKDAASNYDKLTVSDGATTLEEIRGTDAYGLYGWDRKIYFLKPGKHEITWKYWRNKSQITSGDNCFWVRSVRLAKPIVSHRVHFAEGNTTSRLYEIDEPYGSLPIPQKNGFLFGGWYSDPSLKSRITASTAVTASVSKLYAKWTAGVFSVSFAANGGKGKMEKQTFHRDKAVKLHNNTFERSGYVFLGWAKKKNGTVAYTNAQSVRNIAASGKTVTLYAVWAKKSYKVAFFANGGKGIMSVQKMTYGKASKLAANKFKRKGHVFKGWAKTKALAKKGKIAYRNRKSVKNLEMNGKTVKLYAVWKKK